MQARVLVVAVLAFALGCGDDCAQPRRDAPTQDAALGDASCLDAGSPQPSYSRSFGESYFDTPYGVALDIAGHAIITGGFYNTIDFGGGPLIDPNAAADDIFVAKLDANGNHLWSL